MVFPSHKTQAETPEYLACAERIPQIGQNQEIGAIQATSDPKYGKSNAKCTARDIQPRAFTEVCPYPAMTHDWYRSGGIANGSGNITPPPQLLKPFVRGFFAYNH